LAEQGTVNPWVAGSSPASPAMTKPILKLIDNAITQISGRELVSSAEMTDLLLDIRLHLMVEEEADKTQELYV
jgi:hypothetical protein